MTVQERIRILKVIELMDEQPVFAKEIGLSANSGFNEEIAYGYIILKNPENKNSNRKRKEKMVMEITLESVEKVMAQTGVEYKVAKDALLKTDGNVDEAIKLLQPEVRDIGEDVKALIEKLKKKVEEGNVDRVQIRKNEEIVLSVPLNVGIVGGILGFAAAPWALIAGSVAAFGLGCKLEVVKKDGSTDEVQ